jgi:carboxymethylenebutenolidase
MTITRRELLARSAVAAGFAVAVRPISASTVITGSEGLTVGDVDIAAGDTTIPAYRAMPSAGGPFPTVIVVHEIFGVHEYVRDVCRRMAKLGYFAVAPYLYARQGDVTQLEDINTVVRKVVARVPDAQVLSDLDAVVTWAQQDEKADAERLAITGFCWGGRIVWLYCDHNPKVKAGVAWYGRLTWQKSSRQPKHPIDLVETLQVPVLGLYGARDRSIPVATVNEMHAALKKAGTSSELVVFPDAEHGFHADYRPTYQKEAAQEAWEKMRAWFREHGAI